MSRKQKAVRGRLETVDKVTVDDFFYFARCLIRERNIVAEYIRAAAKTVILSAVSTPISFSAQPIAFRHLQAFNIIISSFPFIYRNVPVLQHERLKVCFHPAKVKAEKEEHPCRQTECGAIHPKPTDA